MLSKHAKQKEQCRKINSNLLERFDCKGLDSSSFRELSIPANRLPTSSLTSTARFDAVIKQLMANKFVSLKFKIFK